MISMAVLAVGVSSLRADGYVWKTSLFMTNAFGIVNNGANKYASQTGNYHVPTIDATKFVVTNAIFRLNGVLAGAIWGGDSDTQMSGFIQTAVQVYGFSDPNTVGPDPGASSFGFCVSYPSQVIPVYPTNYFLSGSPFDQGGYINVSGQYSINVEGGLTYIPTGTPLQAGLTALVIPLRLDVELDVLAISNATAADLPPSNPPTDEPPLLLYDLGDLGLPLPPIPGLPDDLESALGLNINSVEVQGNDVHIILQTSAGKTNYVQASSGLSGFSDISGPIVASGTNQIVTTEFVDTGGATNGSARFYRVRLVR